MRYLLVVHYAPRSIRRAIRELRKQPQHANLGVLILTPNPVAYTRWLQSSVPVVCVACSFRDRQEIATALGPYKDLVVGVACRADKHVQYLRRVAPFLPVETPIASEQSLAAATNKRLMRQQFDEQFPEITPVFLQVHDATQATVEKVEAKLSYPVMVKPANLCSSVLVQACFSRPELRRALSHVFGEVQQTYIAEGREDTPQVIVESYLEGDFYSIDAYVLAPGEVYFCPPVAYIPAKQLGIDDFFLYKRFVPTKLSKQEVAHGNAVAVKAIASVGLTYSSVHVELVLTSEGWKIIELGPRLGRFRQTMYLAAYGLNHSYNDILIHLGRKPQIPAKRLQYCAAYSIYPETEGRLREITGLDKLRDNPMVCFYHEQKQPGDVCRFAKNGGHAIVEFVIASPDKHAYDSLVRYVEQEIKAVID